MKEFAFTDSYVEMFNEIIESLNRTEDEDQETGN